MPNHTYNDGRPYLTARGRYAEHRKVEYRRDSCHPIIRGRPSQQEFLDAVERELKIRAYQPNTVRTYISNLTRFLNWFGGQPHQANLETVRCFLEVMVDGGAQSSTLTVCLAAIRTAFDKFCGRDITLGLVTPRKPKRLPVVPSRNEIKRILQAASTFRDKLLIGLMYATGARISEVASLRWENIDFDQNVIVIRKGKGRVDRTILLPKSFRPLLSRMSELHGGEGFVFSCSQKGRYISPRTIQRIVSQTVQLAGISKRITSHGFRHAFATHLLENGTDIRFIQKLLGHTKLETTTIYTKVAQRSVANVQSPFDQLKHTPAANPSSPLGNKLTPETLPQQKTDRQPIGSLRIELKPANGNATKAELIVRSQDQSFRLDGIVIREKLGGWLELSLPPLDEWIAEIKTRPFTNAFVERIKSFEFYEFLREQIVSRYQALPARTLIGAT